jgi:AbrB family looped-hinge helix DNA binding protein
MSHSDLYTIALGERGRLVLPARLRQRLDLHPGDRLIITVDAEGGFRVVSGREQARRLRGVYRHLAPGRSLADELIAERREEGRHEDSPHTQAGPHHRRFIRR